MVEHTRQLQLLRRVGVLAHLETIYQTVHDFFDEPYRMECPESVKFCNWPMQWTDLEWFFHTNASTIKDVTFSQRSLRLGSWQPATESWNKVAIFFNQKMESIQHISFEKLTTHRELIPSPIPLPYPDDLSKAVAVTWLGSDHVMLRHIIAATGMSGERLRLWAGAQLGNVSVYVNAPLEEFESFD